MFFLENADKFSITVIYTQLDIFCYIFLWILIGGCIGGAGFMEYYVQRHGDQPVFAYSVMSAFLAGIVVLTLILRLLAVSAERKMENCVG